MGYLRYWIVCCALAAATSSHAAQPAGSGASQAIPQVSYRFWEREDGESRGWQVVTPLSLTSTVKVQEKLILDAGFRIAHIVSDFDAVVIAGLPPGPTPVSGHVEAFSDSVLGGTLTYLGMRSIEPFVTLDFNLPTGKETLFGSEKNAIMDPDLVDQVRFGEGLNVNAAVGATVPLSNAWIITGAVGFNARGDYVPDGNSGLKHDPGDHVTAYLRFQYLGKESFFAIAAKYFDVQMSTLAGVDYFNPGNRIDVEAQGSYQVSEHTTTTASLTYQTSAKNQYLNFFTGTVADEEANGNGDVYRGQLAVIHAIGDVDLLFRGTATLRTENDYDPVNDLFIPQRMTWDVGPGADWRVSQHLKLSAAVRIGELYDDPTPFIPAQTTYTKLSSFLSGTFSF